MKNVALVGVIESELEQRRKVQCCINNRERGLGIGGMVKPSRMLVSSLWISEGYVLPLQNKQLGLDILELRKNIVDYV